MSPLHEVRSTSSSMLLLLLCLTCLFNFVFVRFCVWLLIFFFWPPKENNLLHTIITDTHSWIFILHMPLIFFADAKIWGQFFQNHFIALWFRADVFLEWQKTNWPQRLDHKKTKYEQCLFLLILDSYRSGNKVLHLLLASVIRQIQNEQSTNYISEDYLLQIGIWYLNFAAVNW